MMLTLLLAACSLLAMQQSSAPTQALAVYSVSGAVVSSIAGQPIPDADVVLAPQFPDAQAQVVETDSSGRFTFLGVVPGRYTLRALHRGFATQNYMQHGPYFAAVIVGPEFDTSNLTLAMLPEGAITGHVYGSDGEPVRYAQVSIFARQPGTSAAPTPRSTVMADDQGRYRASRLLPGTYYVAVSAEPWYARHAQRIVQSWQTDSDGSNPRQVFWSNPQPGSPDPALDVSYPLTFFSNANDLADAQSIELSAGEVETADVTLTALPSRHLIVNISLPPNQFPNFTVRSGLGGSFSTRGVPASQIAPGVWELSGIPPGPVNLDVRTNDPRRAPGTGFVPSQQHVQTISLGNETEVNLSAPGSGVRVKGAMSGEAGFKPSGSRITLSGSPGRPPITADVSADGSFEFSSPLDPGEYSLGVAADAPHFLTQLTATGAKVSGRRIEIGSSDVQIAVTISAANAQISGYAVRDAKHVAGTLVALLPETPGRDVAPVRFYESDGDGSFRFQNVVPGQYKLVALDGAWSAPDWSSPEFAKKFAPQGKSVSVTASGEAKIDLPVIDVSKTPPAAPSAAQHNFR